MHASAQGLETLLRALNAENSRREERPVGIVGSRHGGGRLQRVSIGFEPDDGIRREMVFSADSDEAAFLRDGEEVTRLPYTLDPRRWLDGEDFSGVDEMARAILDWVTAGGRGEQWV